MGYALSILMCALQTWLYTKLWDSFFDGSVGKRSGRIW